jgi:AAA domain/BID domain of Bartonella effector protein (Bep)
VLVGDAEQLQAIEAGAAFRAIADQVGMMAISEPRRQGRDWQRLATKELATARTGAALGRYHDAGMVHWHATRAATRAGVVAGWDAARRADPAQSQIILAHERADVRVLNEAARALRRAAGELGPDHLLQTELGSRAFAEGDRLYFLRNERGLGVKNGTLGTLAAIDGEQLTVRLDGLGGAGTGREVCVDLADYADLDHGYAATVHKSQGITVDQAHVLATPGMDRHLVYVAMSRHRHAAHLHWATDEFGDLEQLGARLGRERAKDTTLDYAEQPDPDPIAAYAGWRGLDPLRPVNEIVLAQPVPETKRPIPESRRDRGEQGQSQTGPWPASLPARGQRLQSVAAAALAALARHGEAQAGRDREMHQPSAPPSPSPADHRPRAQSSDLAPQASIPMEERLAGLEASLAPQRARDRLEPMLPAVPYQPVTKVEVARLVAEHLATQPCPLQCQLEKIYRNPVAARARLDALMQKSATVEELIAQLEKKGAGVLGKLRGRGRFFAGADAYMERHLAKLDVLHLPSAIRKFSRLPAQLENRYRLKLEIQRGCEAVEVPGLSTKALAAITSLHRVGVSTTVSVQDRPVEELSSSEIRQAARVAPAWNAIPPWVRAELAVFREAANARLGSYTDVSGNEALSKIHGLSSNIAQAEQLADRHAAVEVARLVEQHAEAQRRQAAQAAAQAAAEARLQAAEKAELERKVRELQPRSRPSPSPGPTMG